MKSRPFENPGNSYELAFFFRYASRLMARAYHDSQKHDRHGHRGHHAQGKALAIIRDKGPISQVELLEIMDVRSSSLSELLGKLSGKGLIERERSETDKRSFIITATKAADELLAAREEEERAAAERIFSCLDPEERKTLHELLTKIVNDLQDSGDPRPHGRGPGKGRKRRGGRGARRQSTKGRSRNDQEI